MSVTMSMNVRRYLANNDVQNVERLLRFTNKDQRKDIVFKENSHLLWKKAGEHRSGKLLEYLLKECAADVDVPNDTPDDPRCKHSGRIHTLGRTPLLHAIHRRHLERVKVLVNYGADINALVDKLGVNINTSLIHACEQASSTMIPLVKFLLENGAKVNLRNTVGLTALHWAVRKCNHEIIKLLLENGAEFYSVPFVDVLPYVEECSRRTDGIHTLETLLQHLTIDQRKEIIVRVDKHIVWNTAGVSASTKLLEYLLDKCGAEVDTPIYSPDMPQDECQRITKLGGTPLLHAICYGNYRNVQLLVKHGADINARVDKLGVNINTSLIHACEHASSSMIPLVKFLLQNGAKVKLRNTVGLTALHLAVRKCNHEIIKLLLENGAEFYSVPFVDVLPYAKECSRRTDGVHTLETLLQHLTIDQRKEIIVRVDKHILWNTAGESDSTKLLEYLLDKCGAEVDTPNYSPDMPQDECQRITKLGATPLLHAICNGNYRNVQVLVKHGADVNALVDKWGKSIDPSIIHACRPRKVWVIGHQRKSMDIVNFLVESGANVNLRNHKGLTALHQALGNDNYGLAFILLESGGATYWDGFVDVLPYFAMCDRQDTMKFLMDNTIQPDRVIADAYEVLGARALLAPYDPYYNFNELISEAATHWKKAMGIRYKNRKHPSLKYLSTERNVFFLNEREPQTMQELLMVLSYTGEQCKGMQGQGVTSSAEFLLLIHSMLIYERVVGDANWDYIELLEKRVSEQTLGADYIITSEYIKLLDYAFNLCLKHNIPSQNVMTILDKMCKLRLKVFECSGQIMNFLNALDDGLTPGKELNIKLNNSFKFEIMQHILFCLLSLIQLNRLGPGNSDTYVVDPDLMNGMLQFCSRVAKVNPVDKHNRTVLHLALEPFYDYWICFDGCRLPDLELTQLLIQSGFDIDWRDDNGNTCLMNVIGNSHRDIDNYELIVRCLLQAGPHLDIRNKLEMTCLDIAKKKKYLSPSILQEISEKFIINSREMNLMCISARTLADSDILYENAAPKKLLPFIDMHNTNKWSVKSS